MGSTDLPDLARATVPGCQSERPLCSDHRLRSHHQSRGLSHLWCGAAAAGADLAPLRLHHGAHAAAALHHGYGGGTTTGSFGESWGSPLLLTALLLQGS